MTKIESSTPAMAPEVETMPTGEKGLDAEVVAKQEVGSQEVDCWKSEAEDKGFFAKLGSAAGQRLDEVVEVGRGKIEEARVLGQEIRDGVREISRPIVDAAQPLPPLEVIERFHSGVVEMTMQTLSQYGNSEVKEALERIESGEAQPWREVLNVARDEEAMNYMLMAHRSEAVQGADGLLQELSVDALKHVARHEVTLQGMADSMSQFGGALKDVEDAMDGLKLMFPAAPQLVKIMRVQQEVMTGIVQGTIDRSVNTRENTDSPGLVEKFMNECNDLKAGQAFVANLGVDISITHGVGGAVKTGVEVSVEREGNGDLIVRMQHSIGGKVNVGEEMMGDGAKAAAGGGQIDVIAFRFDSNNPQHMEDMQHLVAAHAGLMSAERLAKALPDHVEFITRAEHLDVEVKGGIPEAGYLNIQGTTTYTETRRPVADGVLCTRSFEIKHTGSAGTTRRLQLPASVMDQIAQTQDEPQRIALEIHTALMGNQFGDNASAAVSLRVGYDHADGDINAVLFDKMSRLFVEVSGDVKVGTRQMSGTVRHEIFNPVELARLMGTSVKELSEALGSQSLNFDELSILLTSKGRDLSEFFALTVEGKTVTSDGYASKGRVLSAGAVRKDTTTYGGRIFPPESWKVEAPQIESKDAVEANQRLLDRHLQG